MCLHVSCTGVGAAARQGDELVIAVSCLKCGWLILAENLPQGARVTLVETGLSSSLLGHCLQLN